MLCPSSGTPNFRVHLGNFNENALLAIDFCVQIMLFHYEIFGKISSINRYASIKVYPRRLPLLFIQMNTANESSAKNYNKQYELSIYLLSFVWKKMTVLSDESELDFNNLIRIQKIKTSYLFIIQYCNLNKLYTKPYNQAWLEIISKYKCNIKRYEPEIYNM